MRTLALAGLVVLALAGVASGAGVGRGASLRVRPKVGGRDATFRVRYQVPATPAGGDAGGVVIALTGPRRAGCASSESVSEPGASPGSRVVARLRPPRGRRWCVGSFRGEVQETIRPRCKPGQMCPQFIAILPIGHFRFAVRH